VGQLWLFWVAPIVGALLAGWFYRQQLSDQTS
jgi:aquaporin Z